MQAARANTAEATHRLWSRLADITHHLLLRVTLGNRPDEDAGSTRDEIRTAPRLSSERTIRTTPEARLANQEFETTRESVDSAEMEQNTMRRAPMSADRGQL